MSKPTTLAVALNVGDAFRLLPVVPEAPTYVVTKHRIDDEGHACFSFECPTVLGYARTPTWSVAMGPAVKVSTGYTNRKAKRQRCKARRRLRLSSQPALSISLFDGKTRAKLLKQAAKSGGSLLRSAGRRGGKTYAGMLEIDS